MGSETSEIGARVGKLLLEGLARRPRPCAEVNPTSGRIPRECCVPFGNDGLARGRRPGSCEPRYTGGLGPGGLRLLLWRV